jgi:hypothetical protein
MSNLRKIRKTMRSLNQRTDVEFAAFLGDLSGTVKADNNYNVYVTLLDGQVKTVRNQRVPNVARMPVIVGYDPTDRRVLQVLRSRPAYNGAAYPDVVNHAPNHEWGGIDPLWVRGEAFLPGLVVPNSGLTVRIFGFVYYLDGWHLLNTQDVDLSGNLPTSGARYVLAEVDEAGTVSLRDGSDVASRGALTYADIPAPAADKKALFAVATYAGQTVVVKNLVESDIVDLRWGGVAWDVALTDDRYVRKFEFASDPTASDDDTEGYLVMDEWLNTSSGDVFKLKDATTGAAVWELEGGGGGGGHVIEDEGTPLTQREALNFIGAGVTVTDDAGNDASVVTVQGFAADVNAATNKATPIDADKWGIWDSVSGLLAHVTWANIKAALQAAFHWPEVLTANRTYYVRTDGSDSNTGLVDSAGGAFLTAAKANAVVATIDKSGYNILVKFGAGTWNETLTLSEGIGDGSVEWKGTLTLLETASSATVAAGSGATQGTVTKTGQFAGDNHAGKLAYFVTNNAYRVIDSNTDDVLTLVGTAPSSTTQNVGIYDWGTAINSFIVKGAFTSIQQINFNTSYGVTANAGSIATVTECKITNLSTTATRFALVRCAILCTNTNGRSIWIQGGKCVIYQSLCYANANTSIVWIVDGAALEFQQGSVAEGAGFTTTYGIYAFGNVAANVFGSAATGFPRIRNMTNGIYAEKGAQVYNTANVQYAGNTTNENAIAASYGYID